MGQSIFYTLQGQGNQIELHATLTVSGHKGPRDLELSGFLHHNQTIKNLIMRVTSSTFVRFVCGALVNTFSACSFQIQPLQHTLCA